MISSFSDAGASSLVFPIPDRAFFEQPQFDCLLGDNLLQVRYTKLAPDRFKDFWRD
jgi:hypothetical protein